MHHRIKAAAEIQSQSPHLRLEDCFKTPCTCAVLAQFGISKESFTYCQFITDMRKIFKANDWRTVEKRIPGKTDWQKLVDLLARGFYLVSIESHVFLIYISSERELRVDVDTHPSLKFKFPEVENVYKIELGKRS
jgi:hypothetical protein